MAAVSQWEREAIGERTRDAMRHKRSQGERVGNIAFGSRLAATGSIWNPIRPIRRRWRKSDGCAANARPCAASPLPSTNGTSERGGVRRGGLSPVKVT
jgi:hypothetical protein